MNVRDPFNLHRSPAFHILRGTANLATQKVREASTQAFETGRQAVSEAIEDMSFSIPKNVPSFTAPQRELENRAWGSSGVTARSAGYANGGGSVMGGVQDRVGGFFEKGRGDLPMYKDKPYSYASSRRQIPVWKRKRSWGVGGLFVLIVFYFMGFFGGEGSGSTGESGTKLKDWTWLQKAEKQGNKIDWLDRRERVKEAFTLSWDAYDRYAWGMLGYCYLIFQRKIRLT
jgi:hypothetical protein